MRAVSIALAAAVVTLAACSQPPATVVAGAEPAAASSLEARTGGLVRREMPAEDPGPPFYARVGLQVLESEGWVVIPFYRSPSQVPADFNLLRFYDFPGPGGPGAFAAPLLMTGFLLIEPDAPLGTFPRQVELRGEGVPVWLVPAPAFHAAAGDGVLTLAELRGASPLEGTATHYHETLHPREGEHKIVIEARGTVPDGRRFDVAVTHVGDALQSMRVSLR